MDLNALNGGQKQVLKEALLAAFSEATLDELLQLDLNKPALATIVRPRALGTMVFDLVNLSQQEGWTDALVTRALARNPGNAWLKRLMEDLRRIGAARMAGDLRQRLHLFDRDDEERRFVNALVVVPEHEPVAPVVAVISGLREDEAALMLERITDRALRGLYETCPYARVPWALRLTASTTGENLFRDLAGAILKCSALRGSLPDLITTIGPHCGGRAFSLTLQANLVSAPTETVLAGFFRLLGRLGRHDPPLVLLILVIDEQGQSAGTDLAAARQAYGRIAEACRPLGESLRLIDHMALAECTPEHISDWRALLHGDDHLEKDIIEKAYRTLWDQLAPTPRFRLRRVVTALGATA